LVDLDDILERSQSFLKSFADSREIRNLLEEVGLSKEKNVS